MDERRRERFGRYEILAELGRGAMGIVYKARDPKINRVVAVKTVSLAGQSPEEEQEYRERFFREAEAAGRLSHPGIVTIFDVGEEPDTRDPYIVMEFVGGESLEKLLSRDDHKLPVNAALQLALELAEALDCAHGQGVVHRDLKPANILLTEDGHAKIADFGVAKLNLANHTLAGRALGTPAYMSPEQLNGDAVDGRTDLFSLGVVLYTVLTGYRPFQGNSAVTVSFKVVNRDPIRATLLDTELPEGLDYIIDRAMAKDPAERYQRGMEMVLDIQELRAGREPWSKAKLPGSAAANKNVGQAANGRAKPSLGQPRIAAELIASAGALSLRQALSARIKRKSLAWRFAFAGLLVLGSGFGLWVVAFGPKGIAPAATEPAPISAVAAQPAGETQVATPVLSKAPPKAAVQEVAKTLPADRPIPPAPKARSKKSTDASPISSPAMLEIEVHHRFEQAYLSVWVDDRLTYTHSLEGTDQKHLVVFHHLRGQDFHTLQVPSGKRRLRVRVTSDGAISDQSATVVGDLIAGQNTVLRIDFDKRGAMNLNLQ
jgi:tRNA A-37 threonylcarbamoyl transferase component Bud32